MNGRTRLTCCCVLAAVILYFAGCATGGIKFQQAEDLKKDEKYKEAIEYYMKAIRKKPTEARYRLKLMEAVIEASDYFHRLALQHKK